MQNNSVHPETLQNRPLAGSLLMLGSALAFAGVGALAKLAMEVLSTELTVFFRNFIALVLLMPWLLAHHGRAIFATRRPGLHLLRAAAGLAAMYCIFYALNHLQLGEAILLSYTTPIFIPLIAYWWIGEAVSLQTRLAIIVGFVGVVLILKPGAGILRTAAIFGVMAGALMALAQVAVRRMSTTEPADRIVFYFSLISSVVSAVPLLWSWQAAPPRIWLVLVIMGLLAVIGQVMMTNGYRLSPAARIGPIGYANVLFSTLLGWLFWGEIPDSLTWIGAVFICLAGIVTSYQRQIIVAAPGTVHSSRGRHVSVFPREDDSAGGDP